MPTSAETEYTYPLRYPEMIVRGRANTVTMPVYDETGTVATVTASGSTFTLLDPSGTAIVNAATFGLTAAQWSTFITSAWGEILNDLIAAGHLPYLIKSSAAFRSAHKHRAYAKGFQALALHQNTRGNWLEMAKHHREQAEAAWKAINFKTDDDHDGRVDDDSQRRGGSGSVLNMNAPAPGSHRPYRGPPWL